MAAGFPLRPGQDLRLPDEWEWQWAAQSARGDVLYPHTDTPGVACRPACGHAAQQVVGV
jgi:hypothetical protein